MNKYPKYEAQREDIEGLWACGYTAWEIAEELGWTTNAPGALICNLRKRGLDLPPRKSPRMRKATALRMKQKWAA